MWSMCLRTHCNSLFLCLEVKDQSCCCVFLYVLPSLALFLSFSLCSFSVAILTFCLSLSMCRWIQLLSLNERPCLSFSVLPSLCLSLFLSAAQFRWMSSLLSSKHSLSQCLCSMSLCQYSAISVPKQPLSSFHYSKTFFVCIFLCLCPIGNLFISSHNNLGVSGSESEREKESHQFVPVTYWRGEREREIVKRALCLSLCLSIYPSTLCVCVNRI